MSLFELCDYIAGLGMIVAFVLSGIYLFLSICYHIYRYALGDNFPGLVNPDNYFTSSVILSFINPFNFKHPLDIIQSIAMIAIPILVLALGWLFVIPVGIVWYSVVNIRAKNLHKKKMWTILKDVK